jgi:hypothetical protein
MKTPKQPVRRVNRLEKRATKLMDKAQSKWTKAEAIRKNYEGDNMAENKYDQLIGRSTRLADRAKSKATKASYLRDKSGMAPSPIKSQSKSKSIESSTKRKRGM